MALNPPPVVVVQKKRGWGCWGCGCGALLALAVLLVALGIFMGRSFYSMAQAMTSPQGTTIPTTDSGDAALSSAQQKVAAFHDAVNHQQPATLHLSADEINTLIARDPAYEKLRGHVHVDFKDDTASVQASFLLGQFETFMLTDRYFNGTAALAVGLDPVSHKLSLNVRQLQVGDKNLPDTSTSTLNQSLTQIANQQIEANSDARAFIDRATKIAIENGELVIETK